MIVYRGARIPTEGYFLDLRQNLCQTQCPRKCLGGKDIKTKKIAVSVAIGNLSREIKCTASEKQSTTVTMVMFLLDRGRPVTYSTPIWDQGRRGIGEGAIDQAQTAG